MMNFQYPFYIFSIVSFKVSLLKRAAGGFALTMEQTVMATQLAASWAAGLTHLRPLCRCHFDTFEVFFGLDDVTE